MTSLHELNNVWSFATPARDQVAALRKLADRLEEIRNSGDDFYCHGVDFSVDAEDGFEMTSLIEIY